MTGFAKINSVKSYFLTECKNFFSSKFNLLLFVLTLVFSFYYGFKLQEKFDKLKLSYNNDKNAVYKDISLESSFELPIVTNKLRQITLSYKSNTEEKIDAETVVLKIDEVPAGNYYYSSSDDYIKIRFSTYGVRNLKGKNLHISIAGEGASLKLDSNGIPVFKQYGPKSLVKFLAVSLFLIFILFFFFVLCRTSKWKSYNRVFLFSMLFGTAFLFLIPPCSQYDDLRHFDSSYNMSNIMMGKGNVFKTGSFPRRLCDLNLLPDYYPENYHITIAAWHEDDSDYYKHLFKNLLKKGNQNLTETMHAYVMPPQFAYIIGAIGITISRLLHFNQFGLYYFSMFLQLFVNLLIIYLGLRKNQHLSANIIGCLCFSPVILMEFVSFSYDAMLISLSFTVINYAIAIYHQEKKNIKDIAVLAVFSIILFPIKVIYFPITFYILFLLYFTIGNSVRVKIRNIVIGSVASYLLLCLFFMFTDIDFFARHALNPSAKIEGSSIFGNLHCYSIEDFVLNPIHSLFITLHSILDETYTLRLDDIFIITEPFSRILPVQRKMYLLFFVFLLLLKTERDKKIFFSSLLIFIAVFYLCCMVVFTWTYNILDKFWGFQIRYIIPVLPLFFMAVNQLVPERFKISYNNVLNYGLVIGFFYLMNIFSLHFI